MRLPHVALGGLALALVAALPAAPATAEEAECGEHGTTVNFVSSPAEAAKFALKEEKLVFVLHVSGHFEESDYT